MLKFFNSVEFDSISTISILILMVFCVVLISGCIQGTEKGGPAIPAPLTPSEKSIEEQYSLFEQPCYDEKNQRSCHAPSSFSGTGTIVIDNSLMEASPHWILLAAGKTEQEALLAFIQKAEVTPEKRSEWSRFMMKMWMKYPVMYVENGTSAKLVPGKTAYAFSLTPDENAMFQEIERYIAEDMGKSSAKQNSGS
jgi:hypothetical protein